MGDLIEFTMQKPKVKQIVEAALLAAGRPLSIDQMLLLFGEDQRPKRGKVVKALETLAREYDGRGMELMEVGSGYRIQVRADYAPWVSRLWDEKPARYSRALMETLALIAYRQPVTRAEIEDIRGVGVSTNIVKTLLEREWVRVVGHKDVPGRPALYATTREFLDYFGLKSLDELPTLAELRDFDAIDRELELQGAKALEASPTESGGQVQLPVSNQADAPLEPDDMNPERRDPQHD